MSLRRLIEQSDRLARVIGGLIALWLRLCNRTTRWQVEGLEDLRRALADGPVVVVLWHECTAMAPVHWPARTAPLSSLRAQSPIGRVSGGVQAAFGLQPIGMADGASNRAASREVLRRLKDGVSVGLTADGPMGPARVVKDAPLDWARASGRPVFLYAFGLARGRRLRTWDRMLFPLPFTRGAQIYRRWPVDLPRRVTRAEADTLRQQLATALDTVTQAAEDRAKTMPEPGKGDGRGGQGG